jgi:hypothetical protein
MGGLVVGREGHVQDLVVTDLGALQLLFEAGDEAARADHQLGVLGGAAFEGFAVQLAQEVDGDLVAIGGLDGLAGLFDIRLGLAGQFGQGLVQIGVRRFIGRAFSFSFLMSVGVKSGMTSRAIS